MRIQPELDKGVRIMEVSLYCVLFPSSTLGSGALVTKCFNNLKKATGKDGVLQCHGELQYHIDSLAKSDAFTSTYNKPVGSIPYVLSTIGKQNYSRNIRALESIVKAILYCGKQNIPLRGHRDDGTSTSEKKGNFLALLSLMAESDGDLNEHLVTAGKNAKYTSKAVQNELIGIIGQSIRETLTMNMQFFSIIADELTEQISNKEILSICLRFV